MSDLPESFYEFFAGGGMARLGLGKNWECVFSNEFCGKKASAYRLNFSPAKELHVEDVGKLKTSDIPGQAALAWASFPCQDLSLAGNGKGLKGERSGTFLSFWRLMDALKDEGRGVLARPGLLCRRPALGPRSGERSAMRSSRDRTRNRVAFWHAIPEFVLQDTPVPL